MSSHNISRPEDLAERHYNHRRSSVLSIFVSHAWTENEMYEQFATLLDT